MSQSAEAAASTDVPIAFPTGETLLPRSPDYESQFNRMDFLFDHGLAYHPLFEPRALLDLAARIPKYRDFVYWQNGRVKVDDMWDANPGKRLSLEETIRDIAHNNSLVILKHAEQDPVYGSVLQEILRRIFSFTSPSAQNDIVMGESLIFINSPRRTTAYHLDLESNFLLQIRGEKFCHVHNCADRSVTPHQELENQCSGNMNGAVFKPDRQADAHNYHLMPGHGVHFPSTAPHWVENGNEVSVSININFDLTSIHRRLKRIYVLNRRMRKLGLRPAAPGVSPLRDAIKEKASVGVTAVMDILRRRSRSKPEAGAAAYPQWRPRHSSE